MFCLYLSIKHNNFTIVYKYDFKFIKCPVYIKQLFKAHYYINQTVRVLYKAKQHFDLLS